MSRIIREARQTDVAEIMQVMDAAKRIMRQSGNMHQWGEGYPTEAVITADMERNGGFIIEDDGCIVGYFAFLPSPKPTYAKIYEGQITDYFIPEPLLKLMRTPLSSTIMSMPPLLPLLVVGLRSPSSISRHMFLMSMTRWSVSKLSPL